MARRWVKVISEAEKNERKTRRPFCMNIENVENFKPPSYPPPTTKERLQNRNPLKRDVYRIGAEERILTFSRKVCRDEGKACSSEIIIPERRRWEGSHCSIGKNKPRVLWRAISASR